MFLHHQRNYVDHSMMNSSYERSFQQNWIYDQPENYEQDPKFTSLRVLQATEGLDH
jgi:hypothetical protein